MDQLPEVIIHIPQVLKKEAYENHSKWLEVNERDQKNFIFYSDASLQSTNLLIETGLFRQYAYNIKEYTWHLSSYIKVFDNEFFALTRAFKEAELLLKDFFYRYPNCLIQKIYVFSNNQSAIKRINNLTIKPGQILIHELTNHAHIIIKKFKMIIHVEWISTHLKIPGNERVNKLAEKTVKNKNNEYENSGYTSFTYFKVMARRSVLREWSSKTIQAFKANRIEQHYKQHFEDEISPH